MSTIFYEFRKEDIAMGMPGYVIPLNVTFSPDESKLTYLFPDHTGKRTVFQIELPSGDEENVSYESERVFNPPQNTGTLSLEEQLRRERMRLFTEGISTYEWCAYDEQQYLLIPLGDKLYLFHDSQQVSENDADSKVHMIYDGSLGTPIDPHLSPNGQSVAFVIKNNLFVHHFSQSLSATPIQLTFEGGDNGISFGVADFVAQEEMNRYRGFWWSPDSSRIVLSINDESHIPSFEILHQGKSDPTHTETHRYPFAGKENPKVKVAFLFVPTSIVSSTVPLHYLPTVDESDLRFYNKYSEKSVDEKGVLEYYVCRVDWWPDGGVMMQIENREQNVLQLLHVHPTTLVRTVVIEEVSKSWINLHDMWKPLSKSFQLPNIPHSNEDFYFVWSSERSGFNHLYLYKFSPLTNQVIHLTESTLPLSTGGNWVVDSIDAIDEKNNLIYFSGNYSSPTERHLFRSSLLPSSSFELSGFLRLTSQAGWHSCSVNVSRKFIVDVFSDLSTPIVMSLYSFRESGETVNTSTVRTVYEAKNVDLKLVKNPQLLDSIIPPEIHSIRSSDDKVDLMCALYLPPGVHLSDYLLDSASKKSFPTIMSVYGGPHVQRVAKQWTVSADLRAQRLAQLGIVVIKCDNRGSSRRGLEFESALFKDMGNIEVKDQVAAVDYFASIGLVDKSKVGMFGWSYGGYMSAMSLCRAPDVFSCAVAGAPVTSWDGYDTHYTERYMGIPQENIIGYHDSSVMSHVDKMKGKLLLVHGLIDENVHFRHTARLINGLIAARKRYDLVLFPCERHSPHKLQDKIYMEDIMMDFFVTNLLNK